MSSGLQFDPVFSSVWTILLFILLLAASTWFEARRNHRYRAMRLLAQALMLISLLALLVRPAFWVQQDNQSILLLTPGFDPKDVDSLLQVRIDLRVVSTPGAAHYREAVRLGSYREINGLGNIAFVVGEGLPQHTLDLIPEEQFQFIPANKPDGITRLDVKTYTANRSSFVSGKVSAARGDKLLLRSPGKTEDSIIFQNGGATEFELKFMPKEPGKFGYSLELHAGRSTVTEDLPLEVLPERKLKILMLQHYPNAETRFLKNFLASKGNEVVMRSQVSKDNFRFEFDNVADQRLGNITAALLNDYDLVITDEDTHAQLKSPEREAISTSVADGLGLLLILRHGPSNVKPVSTVIPMKTDKGAPDTVRFSIPGYGYFTQPFLGLSVGGSVVGVLSGDKRILSGYNHHGSGRIGFQLLQETYRIALSGSKEAYAEHWSGLLESVARKENRQFIIRISPEFPLYEDDPVHVDVISTGNVPKMSLDSFDVPLMEDVLTDDVWHGTGWAGGPGWHAFILEGGLQKSFYVSVDGGWSSLRKATQLSANNARTADNQRTVGEDITILKSVSPLVFLLLFLSAAGFLWLAPKI